MGHFNMSTRSSITVKVDAEYRNIYCHFDGYIEHHGPILVKHYNSQDLAEGLIDKGDMSSLGDTVKESEYYIDRGESDIDYTIHKNHKSTLRANKQEYNYLWDGEQWLVDGKPLLEEIVLDGI
jgi:hypothetical protein